MINTIDIKKEITRLLKSKFNYLVYGKEVTEGYKKPSFFVDLRLVSQEDEGINIALKKYHCSIVYFQKKVNESDLLKTTDTIADLLTLKHPRSRKKKMLLRIEDRYIPITGFEQGFTGKNNNIMTIDFDIEFYDFTAERETEEVMRHVVINKELEE